MHSPSDFQRKVFNALAILGLSQVQISTEQNGSFILNTSAPHQRFMYFILRLNSLGKFVFLSLLSCGVFQAEFEFFEKMAILLWFLIFILLLISENLFYRKYPLFELLTAWWRVEGDIYMKLGRPKKFLRDLRWIALWRVWFQGIIALVGVLAVIVQYDAAPKYCVFAYSLVSTENEILKWVFGLHEALFLSHAWLVYGSVIYLSSVIGAELTYNVHALREVLDMFMEQKGLKIPSNVDTEDMLNMKELRNSKPFTRSLSNLLGENHGKERSKSVIASGNGRIQYTPVTLVQEYCHVYMMVTQLNNMAAYNFLYMHACSYVQMVSDVFQMIQILRSPDADFLAVLFFCEDMMVCMYMLFRCFKSMAFLQPSSVQFLENFRYLLTSSNNFRRVGRSDRLFLMKKEHTLREIAFRLGPCKVGPWTVGMAMDVLLQYYICVALWK